MEVLFHIEDPKYDIRPCQRLECNAIFSKPRAESFPESRCHITIEEQMFLFTKGTQKRFNLFQFIQLLVLNFLVLCGHVILRAKRKWKSKVKREDCVKFWSLGTRGSRTKTLNTPPSYGGYFLLNQYPKKGCVRLA